MTENHWDSDATVEGRFETSEDYDVQLVELGSICSLGKPDRQNRPSLPEIETPGHQASAELTW